MNRELNYKFVTQTYEIQPNTPIIFIYNSWFELQEEQYAEIRELKPYPTGPTSCTHPQKNKFEG